MKSIVTINTELPTVEAKNYWSGASLSDYDIVVFDPEFPYLERIEFGGGGSCVTIEGSHKLDLAVRHWSREIANALKAGKTVFVLLNEYKSESLASSYSMPTKGSRTYSTYSISNYSALPISLSFRNAKGRRVKATDSSFKTLLNVVKEQLEYCVLIESHLNKPTFTTNDGTGTLGGVHSIDGTSGHLVLLPYFDISNLVEYRGGEDVWTDEALRIGKGVIGQLVGIDSALRQDVMGTPQPDWVEDIDLPKQASKFDEDVSKLNNQIQSLVEQRESKLEQRKKLLSHKALLFETGPKLERAIGTALNLLDYTVENFRYDDLEIDHIIVGPSGLRMIGEAEGKDNSAVAISKFRQLETNINEDFDREEIETPAKGILFGNGYRLTSPENRNDQFTGKCLTNAKRLGTALVKTSDLYNVALHILDNPNDEKFKEACREALESTVGEVVVFPT